MKDTVDAFIETFTLEGAADGPLSGLTFGAKDIYDVAGHVTGCGNPDWARCHPPAGEHAPAVAMLLDAGATLLGKTHTDEIAYSLMGRNAHYGTPINPAAPDRVPGGSSSGSVAATAAGLVDIGLGTDTGGSVRLPASFSGVLGIRTTHGRIDLARTMPLAPSFDTVGWFARDPAIFGRTAAAFGIGVPDAIEPVRLLIADDAMALADSSTVEALQPTIRLLEEKFGSAAHIELAGGAFGDWREVFRICQGADVWKVHAEWVTKTNPAFGPGVRERFEMAAAITPEMLAPAQRKRAEITDRLMDMLGSNGLILLPTSPGPAPFRDADEKGLDAFRMTALELLCTAGLAGLPQVSLPAGHVDGGPVGLSLLAARGADGALLRIADTLLA